MHFCALISAFCILSASGFARTPDFDPEDVVRQVRSSRPGPSAESREPLALTGEFLIDTSLTLGPEPSGWPAIAFDGENFLVVWEDSRGGSADIFGARVTPEGLVLDTTGIAISIATDYQAFPVLALDGADFLTVWEDYRNGNADVYGSRVTSQGAVLDPAGIAISQAAGDQCVPAVDFDGTNFLAVWEDYRTDPLGDIYGARVTPEGAVFDSGPVARQQGYQPRPRLCCGGGGKMLLVYQGWASTVGGRSFNAYRIWGKIDPSPGIEESPTPLASSHKPAATVVRGVLFLPERTSSSCLLDISGRKVLDLHPGANDVRALAPGVYFVREKDSRGQGVEGPSARKVVVTE